MKNNTYGLVGWVGRLMLVTGLVMITSGMASAWNITATSITVPNGKHGRMYFSITDQNSNTVAGVSLPEGATGGTIRGVPSGSYTLKAFVDTTGTGFQHANDPSFSTQLDNVSGDSGGPAVFTTPAPVTTAAPDLSQSVMPIDSGAFVNFKPDKNNNLPTADRHTIYWSTGSDPANDQTGGGSLVITSGDPKAVIYNLTNGTQYWFAVRAENSVNQPVSSVIGPIVPAAQSASASTVNVPVDTTGITKNSPQPTPLIVVVTDNNNSFYFSYVKSPTDVQTVPVTGVQAGTYLMYTILDLSGTGNLDDPANVTNMNGADRNQRSLPVTADGVSTITAPTTKLAVKNAGIAVNTNHSLQNGIESFSLGFNVAPMSKQLVNVTLVSGSQISGPIDMGMNSNNDKNGSYGLSVQVPNRPAVGATYTFSLYFADAPATGVPGSAAVTAVLDNFPANNFPVGATGPGSVSPSFGWINPGNLPGFVYTSLNMNNNGIDFLPMNVLSAILDGASFPVGQTYQWDRSVQDLDGNQARQSMSFTPNSSGPVISNISSTSGAAGTSVTITGSGFDPVLADYSNPNNPNKVRFNGAQATVNAASATSLTVTVPPSSGVITVTVGSSIETPNNCPSCVTAGSSAAFNATTTFSGAAQDNSANNLSGVGIALAENPTVTIGTSDSTATNSPNFSNLPVPARPYFSLLFSKSSYYPTYTALMSINAPNSGNWSVFSSVDLSGRSVLPASGKSVIIGKVQDWTNGSSANLGGAVVTATSLIHPDAPYTVKYTDTTSNVAQDPVSYTMTAGSGPGKGLFYVVNVDEGDYVTVTASKASMGFQNRVFNTHGDSVSSHSVRGATPGGTPIATPAGGSYAIAQSVTFSGGGTYDDIVYTTDGSDPMIFGKTYSGAISITTDTTLKFATKNRTIGQAFGAVQTQVYSIGASIAGQVTDANTSIALQFATVQLYDQNGTTPPLKTISTDSSGNYKFSGLVANTYKVCFNSGQSYVSQCWQNTADNPASATPIIVAPLAQVTGINAALQTGATITGRVTRDGINGINNVSINVYDTSGNWIPGINGTMTDSSGNYTLPGIPSGSYKLYFNGQSANYVSQWYNGVANQSLATTIGVTAGNTYPGYDAQLSQGGTISGRVTNSGATGIQNVSVQVRDTSGNWIPNINGTSTNSNGDYTLGGLPAGDYKIYFDGSQTIYISQWFNNAPDQSSATILHVLAGGALSNTNAVLSLGGTISGTVTNGSIGIQNISVQLRDTSGNGIPNIGGATTDASGNYAISGIPLGSYKLYFDGQSTGYTSQWYNNAPDQSSATVIPVSTPGVVLSGRNAVLVQGANISGTVSNGLTGIQNVFVQLYNSTGITNLSNTNTDASGGYHFNGLQAGTYKVCFTPGQTNYIAQCYNNLANDAANATGIPLTVPGGNSAVNATMTLGGGISGQVTNGSSGIQNISVEVRDTSGNTLPGVFSMWTDAGGNYTVRGIPAGGNVKVYFNPNITSYGGQWYNNKTSSASADLVPIIAGFTSSPISAVLAPATVPGAPTITSIVPGNGQMQVFFNAPASDGGLQIQDYTVTVNPGGHTSSGSGSPISVFSLTNGQNYTVSVTARNNLGNGAAASTPYSLPLPVNTSSDLQAAVTAVAADGTIWSQAGTATLAFPPLLIAKGVTISGGYNFDYSSTSGFTIIPGRVNIQGSGFKVIFKNVKVNAP
jgi:hypothetical protein